MFFLKHFLTVFLSVSILLAGSPVRASQRCNMCDHTIMSMNYDGTVRCDSIAIGQDSQKPNPCSDANCNGKCSAMIGSDQASLPEIHWAPSPAGPTDRLAATDQVVLSRFQHTQDRPPKQLS